MKTELKRAAASPYWIAWENDLAFHLTPEYVKSHYSERWKLDFNRSWIDVHFIAVQELQFSLSKGYDKFLVNISLNRQGLEVRCNCGKSVQKLCQHVALILLEYATKKSDYFKKFNKEKLDVLSPDQLKLFKLKWSYNNTLFVNHPEFGRVFKYENHFEDRAFDTISFYQDAEPIKPPLDQVRFAIPVERTIGRMPVFLPFLSHDSKGDKFGKSYLTNPVLPKPDFHHTPTSYVLENISQKMLDLYERIDESGAELFQLQMLNLWRQTLTLTKDLPALSFISGYGRKLYQIGISDHEKMETPAIRVSDGQLELNFRLYVADTHMSVHLDLIYQGQMLENPKMISNDHSFFFETENGQIIFIDDLEIAACLQQFRQYNFKYTALNKDEFDFFDEVLTPLASCFQFLIHNEDLSKRIYEKSTPEAQKVLKLCIADDFLHVQPLVQYSDDNAVKLSQFANICIQNQEDQPSYFYRDKTLEQNFSIFLEHELGQNYWQPRIAKGSIPLSRIRKTNWLSDFLAKCAENGIQIENIGLVEGSDYYPYKLTWEFPFVQETDHEYHVAVQVKFGNQVLSLYELKDLVFKTKNLIALEDERYGWLSTTDREYFRPLLVRATISDHHLIVPSRHVLALERIVGEIKSETIRNNIQQKKDKLSGLEAIPLVQIPNTVHAKLRPYQHVGVSWMVFLKELNWGGILADEMGLGKTLQVITLLEYHFNLDPESAPALIVVPNSLLFNWVAEIEKFAPARRFQIHHGPARLQTIEAAAGSLVITTYGTLMADEALFTANRYSYFILDESQSVKNRSSKRFKTAAAIQAEHIIALSGTPIENGIEDLYTQFNLVNANFFGSFSAFKKTYVGVVDGTASEETMRELQKTINPFMLRRTKLQVASELPERTETLLYLDMLPEQRQIYEQYRQYYKGEIEKQMTSHGTEKVKFLALEGLMKLRLICNSPSLLKGQSYPESSIKIEKLIESLKIITKDHKVLVFSFFTSMLQLVSKALQQEEVTHTYLDGQMKQKDRQAAVEKFQEEDGIRVFLISLRAGGTGLNLTAADYVYILDPWWNPAVESQAIGRSHRIGQERPVMAYKMACRNSVEEAIIALQERKKKLADELILEESNLLKTITKDDLLKLFT